MYNDGKCCHVKKKRNYQKSHLHYKVCIVNKKNWFNLIFRMSGGCEEYVDVSEKKVVILLFLVCCF